MRDRIAARTTTIEPFPSFVNLPVERPSSAPKPSFLSFIFRYRRKSSAHVYDDFQPKECDLDPELDQNQLEDHHEDQDRDRDRDQAPNLDRSQRPRVSLSRRLTTSLRLRYYRYEVTMGLYMMTTIEKLVLNVLFLGLFALLVYGLYCGLESFVFRTGGRIIYYATGKPGMG